MGIRKSLEEIVHVIGAKHHPQHTHQGQGGFNHLEDGIQIFTNTLSWITIFAGPHVEIQMIEDHKQIDDT